MDTIRTLIVNQEEVCMFGIGRPGNHPEVFDRGVRLGVCTRGKRRGAYVLVSELYDKRSQIGAWLVEYFGEPEIEPYDLAVHSEDELQEELNDSDVAWITDPEAVRKLARHLFPQRF